MTGELGRVFMPPIDQGTKRLGLVDFSACGDDEEAIRAHAASLKAGMGKDKLLKASDVVVPQFAPCAALGVKACEKDADAGTTGGAGGNPFSGSGASSSSSSSSGSEGSGSVVSGEDPWKHGSGWLAAALPALAENFMAGGKIVSSTVGKAKSSAADAGASGGGGEGQDSIPGAATAPGQGPDHRNHNPPGPDSEVNNLEILWRVTKWDLSQLEVLLTTRGINPDSELYKDLVKHNLPGVRVEINMPEEFPMAPPFVRVVHPKLEGGFVFPHGAICFEPLTPKGWVCAMGMPNLATAIKGILDYHPVKLCPTWKKTLSQDGKMGGVQKSVGGGAAGADDDASVSVSTSASKVTTGATSSYGPSSSAAMDWCSSVNLAPGATPGMREVAEQLEAKVDGYSFVEASKEVKWIAKVHKGGDSWSRKVGDLKS